MKMTTILLNELNQNNLKLFFFKSMQGSCHTFSFSHYADGELDTASWEPVLSTLKNHSSHIVCVGTLTAKTFFPWIVFLRSLHRYHPTASVIFIAPYLAHTRTLLPVTDPALTLLRDTLDLFQTSQCFVVDPHQSLNDIDFSSIHLVDFYQKYIQHFRPKTTIILAPDKGRQDFVEKLSAKTDIPSFFLTKERSHNTVTLLDVPSTKLTHQKDIIIFDDIIDSGATITAIIEHLKEKTLRSLHIFITHWLLQPSQESAFYDALSQCKYPVYLKNTNTIGNADFPTNLPPHVHCATLDLSHFLSTFIHDATSHFASTRVFPPKEDTPQSEGVHV